MIRQGEVQRSSSLTSASIAFIFRIELLGGSGSLGRPAILRVN